MEGGEPSARQKNSSRSYKLMETMKLVERHIIKRSSCYWEEIDQLAFKSKISITALITKFVSISSIPIKFFPTTRWHLGCSVKSLTANYPEKFLSKCFVVWIEMEGLEGSDKRLPEEPL
jgi:hypothetical protein